MTDTKKEIEKIIASSKIALKELDKLIKQEIDLTELDPEKAKAAAQGKIEAIEGSFKVLALINENESKLLDDDSTEKKNSFFGVENKVK